MTTNALRADSLASSLRAKGYRTQEQITAFLKEHVKPTELPQVEYRWDFWARDKQLAPDGDWFVWLILTGRGWGKTRTCAEFVRAKVEAGEWRHIALVNDTARDTRRVNVLGVDGLLSISPPWCKPIYEPSKATVTWPNGAEAYLYSAEAPELLRGPQHDGAWCDEPTKWRNLRKKDQEGGTAWDNLMMGLREGSNPQCVVGATPRSIPWLHKLLAQESVVVTRGTFYDNVQNLAPPYVAEMKRIYEGTRLGRQELAGELLDDVPGALWTRQMIEDSRVSVAPEMLRIVVAIDPAMTSGEDADETGIVTCGKAANGHCYVLRDMSGHFTPQTWAQRALYAYSEYRADRIIGEVNNGGEMVEHTIRSVDRSASYKAVHASRGKRVRAEPIAALSEQGKLHMVGSFPELEDQMSNFVPDMPGSPDRLDAMVWAVTDLMEMGVGAVVQ